MYEAPSRGSQPNYAPGTVAAPTPGDDAATERMAQLILMGMQRDIETQIDWRLQQQATTKRRPISNEEIGVILGSMGIAIPLTAIAAASSGFAGILVVWIGLVLINLAWSQRH
jgi:hypothetical protein